MTKIPDALQIASPPARPDLLVGRGRGAGAAALDSLVPVVGTPICALALLPRMGN